ncbi:zinc finger MYM-type protein 1-like [Antedon mediterranea]|uniref:zinc finger MYM-type protein 1-like n=1 Tax=Antedon mediterranea TaxID=105859 RepID=UPI003AF50F92
MLMYLKTVEQVSFVLRYALEGETYESFLKFQNVESTTAEALFKCLCETLKTWGLDIKTLRGQGYDGASNMSGRYNGLKTKVLNENPKALYVHCSNHCLNLVLVAAFKSNILCKNFFGIVVERLYVIIEASPKRDSIFVRCQKERNIQHPSSLKRLSETRWASHCDSLRTIEKTLPALLDALEEIAEEEHDNKIVSNAIGLLESVSTFDFIAAFTVLKDILETIRVASDALQERGIAIDTALQLIDNAEKALADKRSDEYYKTLMSNAKKLASKCEIPTEFKQHRQRRRKQQSGELAGDEVLTPEESFKANVFYGCIDICRMQIKERFAANRDILKAFRVLLTPSLMKKRDNETVTKELEDLSKVYGSGPHPDIDPATEIPQNASAQDMFKYLFQSNLRFVIRNLYRLYAIFCTIPATSVETERSFSKLKIIKDYRRSTMGQDRLSGLAILSIERNIAKSISFDHAIQTFAEMRPRKIHSFNLLFRKLWSIET